MKNLSSLILAFCIIGLFSVQAGASTSYYPQVQLPSAQQIQQQNDNAVQQWNSSNKAVQQMRQDNEKTQNEMANFGRLDP
jgi:hypothetical protein